MLIVRKERDGIRECKRNDGMEIFGAVPIGGAIVHPC